MEFFNNLLDNTQVPVLYAFILGLITSISPCPLATNITAIAFIGRDIENKRKIFLNGIIYTLGRAITYTGIGLIIYFGASRFHVSGFFTKNGEKFLGPLLILLGILMLDIFKVRFPSFWNFSEKFQRKFNNGSCLSSLFLGIIFAMAFCPYSGVLYFGLLIPMTIAGPSGLFLPVVFAVATGLIVVIISYLLAFSISGIGIFYKKVNFFQKWINRIVAVIFILVGIYYISIYFII